MDRLVLPNRNIRDCEHLRPRSWRLNSAPQKMCQTRITNTQAVHTAHVPLAHHICTSNPLRYEQLSFASRQLQHQLQCRATRVILLFGSAWHPCGRTEIFVACRAPSCPLLMRHVWCHRQMRSLPQRARGRRLVSPSLLRTLLNGGESPHQQTALLSLPPVSHIPM